MKPIKINHRLTIASQPECRMLSSLKNEGFDAVINLRPDDEEGVSQHHEESARQARKSGLDYYYLPVTAGKITRADIRAFQQILADTKGHILAHCASGRRALILHVLGEVLDGQMQEEEIEAYGRAHGIDLAEARHWLATDRKYRPVVEGFFEPRTWSVQYIVTDPETRKCAIIDPVLDYDEKSGTVKTTSADALLDYIRKHDLSLEWILDTHPHADHFSAATYLKEKTGAKTGIGEHVQDVQKLWKGLYNNPDLATDGSQWDHLFKQGENFKLGKLDGKVLFSPGHTLASVTYVIGDAAFVHDTIFMPDSGTARADFPGGSARILWNSIEEILALPDETRIFTGHDYQPGGRHPRWESTVGEQKRTNPHLANMDEAGFVSLREQRDRTLPMPKLILHALQVNTRAGRLPEPENNGTAYLKIPLNLLENASW